MYKFAKKVANHEGFTLVELIVVIAILGILAGIAIPVYSGYIKKANQAKDNVLLGAVNTAFAAASVEGGQLNGRPASANAGLAEDGTVSFVKSPVDSDGSRFASYFAGNESSPFKVFKKLSYNSKDGVFFGLTGSGEPTDLGGGWSVTEYSGPNGTVLSYSNGTTTVDVAEADKAAVVASTFGNKEIITMEDMMNEIGNVVDLASSMLGGSGGAATALTAMTEDQGFKNFMTSLGVTQEDLEEDNTKMMNAMVLYAATNTDGVDSDAMLTQLIAAGSTPAKVLQAAGAGGEDTASQLASAAMIYGLATAYANTNGISGSNAISTLVSVINSDGWKDYLESDQAKADIAGYSGAMGIISDNISNLASDNLLADGFASDDIINMLNIVFDQSGN